MGSTSADAAILRHDASALTAPANSILHERAIVSIGGAPAMPFELWQRAGVADDYRVIKDGHEAIVSPDGTASCDAASNTITIYLYLPATATNLRLLMLTAAHPTARVVSPTGA